uniref:Uncharacterized protein n=1 Tax=Macaca fascicularis TaxID=9541 RepID=Q9MZZ9_MACFA|nr:hypothetical protein [Macaca fascicularis]
MGVARGRPSGVQGPWVVELGFRSSRALSRPSQPGGSIRRRQKQRLGGRPAPRNAEIPGGWGRDPPPPYTSPGGPTLSCAGAAPDLPPSPISSPTPQASPAAPSGGPRASRPQPGLAAAETLGVGTGKS